MGHQMSRSKSLSIYENLDTSFVNLGALLRYLQQQGFQGRVQVSMGDYEALIRLRAGERPACRERDKTTGREGEGDAALQRVLVRATDTGGIINVYREDEQAGFEAAPAGPLTTPRTASSLRATPEEAGPEPPDEETNWQELLETCGELIASVERAARSTGADFNALFQTARLELADDYSFLDPNGGRFEYASGRIELRSSLSPRAFVSGLGEALRRVVEKAAVGQRAASARERVALELAVLARRRGHHLTRFGIMPQLDRIAGTRVL
jgi:hypothetical protein